MTQLEQTPHWATRRRPLDRLERRLVRHALTEDDARTRRKLDHLRYGLSLARVCDVTQPDGSEVAVGGPLQVFAHQITELLSLRLPKRGVDTRELLGAYDEVMERTLAARTSLLDAMPLHRDSLEREITTRQLVVASGGGGGAGYIYPGAYDILDRAGITPALMVGTSMGSLMSMFRCRRSHFDLAALVAAARALSWTNIFRVLETRNRYGLPATLRLYLRNALGSLFQADGRAMRLSDMAIPMYTVATGITVDALKHDLDYYEHLLDAEFRQKRAFRARSSLKVLRILREFLGARDALREVVIGRDEGTEDFDTLDAAGFSSAIPGVIHYDVIRDDPRMHTLLDTLYGNRGITRLGEGGIMSNVPARIAWETSLSGRLGPTRNCFVLALDCFAPAPSRIAWFPFQQAVRAANVLQDRKFADLYIAFPKTLSPLKLVPSVHDAMNAIRWGRAETEPHLPFIQEMLKPLPVVRGTNVHFS